MRSKLILMIVLSLLLLGSGCTEELTPTATPEAETAVNDDDDANEPEPEPTDEPEPTAVPPTSAPTDEEPTAEPEPEPTALPAPSGFSWPAPAAAYDTLSSAPVSAAEIDTFSALAENYPPERDDVGLAIAYRGLKEVPPLEGELVTEPLATGTRRNITVSNIDLNTLSSPEFRLLHVSEHAYFWFDTTDGLSEPSDTDLVETGAAFDEIYEQDTYYFGPESNPGIDGDPRVHIVNASPLTICNVDVSNSHTCGLLGYFGSGDVLPTAVDPNSNQKEMFVMNGAVFGTSTYLDVLAHEFRHMIESNHDVNDWDWEVEGSAMLAEDLLGFPNDPISRGNLFLSRPDQQLNRWVDGNTIPYYGQGYVINRYIFNRLGEELYRVFATHPEPGFAALDDIAVNYTVDFADSMDLYLDWLAALAILEEDNAPEQYFIKAGLNTAAMEGVNSFPETIETTVNQYGADYYRLFGDGTINLTFAGSNHAQLLKVLPASGTQMWFANRANYSNMRMTREFDLTGVDSATLEYAVFHEIELGYDFAYVSVSTDGGQTWQGLVGENMQGDSPQDDPSDVAYTDYFYTGRSGDWVKESVDLSAYAGQMVQIRFEYVTDPILTFGGIAFDNISIPAIDFYDDAERDMGWTAEGFVRGTGYVPQPWQLILVTFVDGTPVVERLMVDETNELNIDIPLDADGGGRPVLIVSATAPMTLEAAHYVLDFQ